MAPRSVVERQSTDLVVNALVMALARRVPDGDLLHHADHGSQYTPLEFTNRLNDWKIFGCISARVGARRCSR